MLGTLHVGSSHSVNHKKHNTNKIIMERALTVRNTTLGFLRICQSQESIQNSHRRPLARARSSPQQPREEQTKDATRSATCQRNSGKDDFEVFSWSWLFVVCALGKSMIGYKLNDNDNDNDQGNLLQHSLQVNMGRALNARSTHQIAHASPDFGNLLQPSLQVNMGRALNARSTHQITHALPVLGNLLQRSLQVDMERTLNARSLHQIAHAFPDFSNLLLHTLQVDMERACNAKNMHQITHAFPDLGNLLQHSQQINTERALHLCINVS